MLETIKFYKREFNVKSVGIYGFCWGGKITVYVASDSDFPELMGIGLVHPSRVSNEEADDVKVPAILLPSSDEPDMVLNTNFSFKSIHVSDS
jgi:dienelactone hydrolase